MAPTRREIASVVADELAVREEVLAVLLAGSTARGEEIDASDLDLLTVLRGERSERPKPRTLRDGYLVEVWAKSEAEWEERFRSARPMWTYAFLEADVVYDTGPAARLRSAAESAFDDYETPEEVRQELATMLWHGEPKLRRALEAGGERAGYWASVFLPEVLEGLYAVHDQPLRPARVASTSFTRSCSRREERRNVAVSCTGSADERLSAIAALYEMLMQRLGPPDLERW